MAVDKAIAVRNAVIGLVLLAIAGWSVYRWKPEWFGAAAKPDEVSVESVDDTPQPATGPDEAPPARDRWVEITGAAPRPPGVGATAASCVDVESAWKRTCDHLDARFSVQDSCGLADELLAALADNPPPVQGELLRHGTMLQNLFHLFRMAGEERLDALREMLGEPSLLEPAARSFYDWVSAAERCGWTGPTMSAQVRTEYAAYLFGTLGGQAYLRRRAPRAEALACFYAIHALDEAQRAGRNPQGYDPRGEIPRCRELLGGQEWTLGAAYETTLDAIESGWRPQAGR